MELATFSTLWGTCCTVALLWCQELSWTTMCWCTLLQGLEIGSALKWSNSPLLASALAVERIFDPQSWENQKGTSNATWHCSWKAAEAAVDHFACTSEWLHCRGSGACDVVPRSFQYPMGPHRKGPQDFGSTHLPTRWSPHLWGHARDLACNKLS